jgi:hypothetical protein
VTAEVGFRGQMRGTFKEFYCWARAGWSCEADTSARIVVVGPNRVESQWSKTLFRIELPGECRYRWRGG